MLLLAVVVFLAVFTQSLAGFGSALVAMAVLPELLGVRVAAPLVALMAAIAEAVLLVRYRQALSLRAVWPLIAASLLGAPLGVLALQRLDERIVLTALGLAILAYAVYALLTPQLPRLSHPAWAYAFGFAAGVLGGAFNVSGPPAVIYGNARRRDASEFKSNLQGFFLINDALVVSGHLVAGNVTRVVWQDALIALPAIALGVLAGVPLAGRLDPQVFRKVVLGLLAVMGARMILSVSG